MEPSLTEFYRSVSALSFMLRLAESPGTPEPRTIELVEGSPEGIVSGVPGDLRIDIRSPSRLWIKRTGIYTATGWQELSGGGGASVCDVLPQPVVPGSAGAVGVSLLASPCDHEHPMDPIAVPLQGVRVVGLDAGGTGLGTGSVNTTVAWWGGASEQRGSVPLANWLMRQDDSTTGTTFKITQAGIYEVLFEINTGAVDITGIGNAITYDAPAGLLNTTPDLYDDPECRAMDYEFGQPAGQSRPLTAGPRLIYVSAADAANAGLGIIRAQLSDLFDGPPAASTISLDNALIEISRFAPAL